MNKEHKYKDNDKDKDEDTDKIPENTFNVPRPPNLSQPNRTAPTFIGSTHWPASTQMKLLLASPPLTKNIS